MRQALDGEDVRHRLVTLFADESQVGRADFSLGGRPVFRASFVAPVVWWRLRRALRRLRPRVVIAYGSEALRYAVLATPRNVRLVYSKTGVSVSALGGARLQFHRWLARRADVVAAVSTATAAEAIELLGLPSERVEVVSNGRDPTVFTPAVTSPASDRVRLLWVGHVVPGKRPDLFLEVVRELRSEGHAVDGALAGDGPLMPALRDLARSSGAELLGRRLDIAEVMRDADLFLFTSDRDGEGLPGVLIEAALSGLPTVATDVPGVRDVILDGCTGLVVGAGDLTALVAASRRLVVDEHARTSMGAAARADASKRLTTAACVERWRALLSRLDVPTGSGRH